MSRHTWQSICPSQLLVCFLPLRRARGRTGSQCSQLDFRGAGNVSKRSSLPCPVAAGGVEIIDRTYRTERRVQKTEQKTEPWVKRVAVCRARKVADSWPKGSETTADRKEGKVSSCSVRSPVPCILPDASSRRRQDLKQEVPIKHEACEVCAVTEPLVNCTIAARNYSAFRCRKPGHRR